MVILITGLSGAATLALWIPGGGSAGGAVAYGAVFGLVGGGYVSIVPAVVAQISDIREIGTRTGITLVASALAALAGSPAAGAIVSSTRGGGGNPYLGLQLFCGVVMIAGSLAFLLARYMLVGFKLTKV